MREARIQIAGITLGVTAAPSCPDIGLDADMAYFSAPDTNPDLNVGTSWRNLGSEEKGEKIFDSGGVWRLYRGEEVYRFHCLAPAFGDVPYKIASITRDFSRGEVCLHRPFFENRQSIYPLEYPLDELFILNLLSRGRGAEVHACGIVDVTGDGYLFVGQSGAGKTTMARLWEQEPGTTILSDDRIILRREKGRIWMYGTPWHGEAKMASAMKAPLKEIYFIRHGRKNSLKTEKGVRAAAHLFSCSFPVFYDPGGLEFTLDFFGEVSRDVPCSELDVVPDRDVLDFIRASDRSIKAA